ncbi:MAG: hypothetical protein JRJ77_14570 [Deltaproteobacteria bacterium]|nr:hypothetical protein [Deltaproteobacteria bacterium]
MSPVTIDNFIEPFILSEVVRIGGKAIEMVITLCDPLKEIYGEKIAFGLYGGECLWVSVPHVNNAP